jgi:hypothetical protein
MRVAHKAGDPDYYMTLRPTRDGDFAAQRILLMRLPLSDTAYYWFMGGCISGSYLLFVGRTLRAMIGSIEAYSCSTTLETAYGDRALGALLAYSASSKLAGLF